MTEQQKQYHREYNKMWREKRRQEYFTDKKCKQCDETDYRILVTHHVNPDTKVKGGMWTWSEKRRNAELAKCIVLCKDCHTELHAAKLRHHGWGRYLAGCRCDICKEAQRVRYKRYWENRRKREALIK